MWRGEKSLRVCSSDILIRVQGWEGSISPKLPFKRCTFALFLKKLSGLPFSLLCKLTKRFKNNQTYRDTFGRHGYGISIIHYIMTFYIKIMVSISI